jgi:hypothetical protein
MSRSSLKAILISRTPQAKRTGHGSDSAPRLAEAAEPFGSESATEGVGGQNLQRIAINTQ